MIDTALRRDNALSFLQAELLADFEREKQDTFAITADMTRQYKAMQEELLRRINILENTIQEQKDQLGTAPSTEAVLSLFLAAARCFLDVPVDWHNTSSCPRALPRGEVRRGEARRPPSLAHVGRRRPAGAPNRESLLSR